MTLQYPPVLNACLCSNLQLFSDVSVYQVLLCTYWLSCCVWKFNWVGIDLCFIFLKPSDRSHQFFQSAVEIKDWFPVRWLFDCLQTVDIFLWTFFQWIKKFIKPNRLLNPFIQWAILGFGSWRRYCWLFFGPPGEKIPSKKCNIAWAQAPVICKVCEVRAGVHLKLVCIAVTIKIYAIQQCAW